MGILSISYPCTSEHKITHPPRSSHPTRNCNNKIMKEGDAVVELDQMKTEILTYETPLAEVRDSL